MKTYKIAFFGCDHPHASLLYGKFGRSERFKCIGFADVPGQDELKEEERIANLGVGAKEMKRFASWQELLAEKPDAAIVATGNRGKLPVCLAALSEGIPVVVEKPMAASYDDALKMVECANEHKTKIITNWPVTWFAPFRKAKELLDSGEIGTLRRVVYRSPATWGPYSYAPDGVLPPNEWLKKTWWYQKQCGGGSLLDYACYGTMLASWMFGREAVRVKCVAKQFETGFCDVEDYSAMLLDFGVGVGLLEGSWSSFNPAEIPTGPILYGSGGVIVCDRYSTDVKIYHGRSHKQIPPTETIALPQMYTEDTFADHLLRYLDGTGEVHETIDMTLNLRVMAALSKGIASLEQEN